MTYDPVDVHASFAAQQGIRFTLLADEGSRIISAFGLIDERMPKGSAWYGIAHPMTIVIDPKGVVTHRFSDPDYRHRIPVGVVIEALRLGAGS